MIRLSEQPTAASRGSIKVSPVGRNVIIEAVKCGGDSDISGPGGKEVRTFFIERADVEDVIAALLIAYGAKAAS